MVGDRDSTTFKKVGDSEPYSHINIEKIDCINHYSKKFKILFDKLENVKIPKINYYDKIVTLKGKRRIKR